jgi:DNA-binding IclR family transcriptional regulator
VRDSTTNRYRLGPATLALCYVTDNNSGIVDAARPFLEALVQETGESVTLAVEVDGYPVCVDIIENPRPFKRRTAPDESLETFPRCTVRSSLRSSRRRRERPSSARSIPRQTPHTVTDSKPSRPN